MVMSRSAKVLKFATASDVPVTYIAMVLFVVADVTAIDTLLKIIVVLSARDRSSSMTILACPGFTMSSEGSFGAIVMLSMVICMSLTRIKEP